jgi:hypothetical protein
VSDAANGRTEETRLCAVRGTVTGPVGGPRAAGSCLYFRLSFSGKGGGGGDRLTIEYNLLYST